MLERVGRDAAMPTDQHEKEIGCTDRQCRQAPNHCELGGSRQHSSFSQLSVGGGFFFLVKVQSAATKTNELHGAVHYLADGCRSCGQHTGQVLQWQHQAARPGGNQCPE